MTVSGVGPKVSCAQFASDVLLKPLTFLSRYFPTSTAGVIYTATCCFAHQVVSKVTSAYLSVKGVQRGARRIQKEPLQVLVGMLGLSALSMQNRHAPSGWSSLSSGVLGSALAGQYGLLPGVMGGAAMGLMFVPGVSAAGGAVGNEFLVNVNTASGQEYPRMAPLRDGGFVIIWNDVVDLSVRGKRYAADGVEVSLPTSGMGGVVGNEFRVNGYTTSQEPFPDVASLFDGGFVVVWHSYGQDGSGYGVYGKRYAANGTELVLPTSGSGGAVGTEFRVNTYTTNDQHKPTLKSLLDGGFVVVWGSAQDGSNDGVYGKRYAANGTEMVLPTSGNGGAIGNEFPINTYTTNFQGYPTLTSLSDGGFVVTWESNGQDGGGTTTGVYGKRYAANGTEMVLPTSGSSGAVGKEFPVNTYTTDSQISPALTSLPDGGFVVTWESYSQDGTIYSVYGKRYAVNGTELALPTSGSGGAVGKEFPINTYSTNGQRHPTLTTLSDGGFVVTWESDSQDGNGNGVYGKRFAANGTEISLPTLGTGGAMGNEFPVNSYTTNPQSYPDIIALSSGGFVITWHSLSQDGSNYGIYGKRYAANGTEIPLETIEILPTTPPPASATTGLAASTVANTPIPSIPPTTIAPVISSSSSSGTSVVPIVAGVLGGVAGVLGISAIAYLIIRRRRRTPAQLPFRHSMSPIILKSHPNIGGAYNLLDTMDQEEATALERETGVRVKFPEGEKTVQFILGKGSFGAITIAQSTIKGDNLGKFFAVKKIAEDKIKESEHESAIQQHLSGKPNIMPLSDSCQSEHIRYEFMPIAGWGNGISLTLRLSANRLSTIGDRVFAHVAVGFLNGVSVMHKNGVCHLDLKPENMVIDQDGNPYIIDFGCAVKDAPIVTEYKIGDTRYFAPERLGQVRELRNKEAAASATEGVDSFDGRGVDVWAAGVSLLEIASGGYPFDKTSFDVKINEWGDDYFNRKITAAVDRNNVSRSLLVKALKLLRTNPRQRDSAAAVLKTFKAAKLHFSSAEEGREAFARLRDKEAAAASDGREEVEGREYVGIPHLLGVYHERGDAGGDRAALYGTQYAKSHV